MPEHLRLGCQYPFDSCRTRGCSEWPIGKGGLTRSMGFRVAFQANQQWVSS
jgi:hypothetical protein